MIRGRRFVGIVAGLLLVAFCIACSVVWVGAATKAPKSPRPKIVFTKVPGPGGGPDSRGDIAGKVTGLKDPQNYKIVLWAHTDVWYVQPLTASPYTSIRKDGKWSNWTHLGTTYGALLVRPSYKPGDTTDELPRVGGDVLAVATVRAKG